MNATAVDSSDSVVQRALQALQDIENKIQDFFNQVNSVISWVPSFLSDLIKPITDGLNWLNQKLQEFWNQLRTITSEPGSPSALNQAAQQWETGVMNVVSGIAGTLTTDQLQAENDWTGQAATAYKNTIPAQTTALGSIKDAANQVNTTLVSLANAINTFWIAIIAATAAFAVAIIGAIAAACTVVGTPAAIAIVVGAVAAAVTFDTVTITALNNFISTINTQQSTLMQKLSDNTNFPNGNWPVSTADMSDDHGGWQPA